MLYHLLLTLEEKKIYRELMGAGVIPFSVNTDFQIYKSYLKHPKEKRKTQIIFNVSVDHKCTMKYVYRAIRKMQTPIAKGVEITF